MNYYLDTSIQTLFDNGDISTRTFNCLRSEGFNTISDVLTRLNQPEDLLKLRNFGRKSYFEINAVLNEVINTPNPVIVSENQLIDECIDKAYEKIISTDDKLSTVIKARFSNARQLHKAIITNIQMILDVEPDLSLEENVSLRKRIHGFVTEAISNLESKGLSDKPIYPTYKRAETELGLRINDFSIYEKAHYFMSSKLHKYIEEVYKMMCQKKLSVRAQNFQNSFLPSFEDFIQFFDKPQMAYMSICPGRSMKKTLSEIYDFNQEFKTVYMELCDKSEDELVDLRIKQMFPYLLSAQRKFVKQYIKDHKHAPLFYAFYEFLRISDNRIDKIFSLQHGLFDNQKRNLAEIGIAMDLSRERIRQLTTKRTSVQKSLKLFKSDLAFYSDLFNLPFVCEETNEYLHLHEKEHLSYGFEIFASLLSQMSNFNLIDVNDHTIAINKDSSLAEVDFKECISTIEALINSKFTQDTIIPVETIYKSQPNTSIDLFNIIKFILVKAFNLNVVENNIVFSQNFIDVSEECFMILQDKGEPMTVTDIFTEFKHKYPDHPFTEPMQIKAYLFRHEHIRSIGKQSLYGLDFWKNIYFGSIRDLMFEIMSNSDEPVHIGEIYEKVTEYFPDTNIKSIASSIQSDAGDRFEPFEDGYFGLKEKDYPDEFLKRKINQRSKYSFEERMKNFRDFVETYHRFPLSNGGEDEASLRRWYYNVENCIIEAPSEEALNAFLDMIEEFSKKGYPRTGYESEFLANCEKYQDFINKNYTLPTMKNGEELYWWLKRSLDNYNSYIDHRRLYLTTLINYIRSLGFQLIIP